MNNQTPISPAETDLTHLRPAYNDEIDLGELIRNIIGQWKLIASITAIGAVLAIAFALNQPSVFKVSTTITLPSTSDLGEISQQTLIKATPSSLFESVLESVLEPEIHLNTLENSELLTALGSTDALPMIASKIRADVTVERVEHDYYALAKDEKVPLKEVTVSLETTHPGETASYLNKLVAAAKANALDEFSFNAQTKQQETLHRLNNQLESLTSAAKESRLAEIARIEETNLQKTSTLNLELSLLEAKAKTDRLKQISKLKEALVTAKALSIVEPVTWDDLNNNTNNNNAQVVNDLTESKRNDPLYFRGSRILTAEITQLENRTDDLLYVSKASQLQLELASIAKDPKLAALKARTDDTIYIATFDDIQQKISDIIKEPIVFDGAELAKTIQLATTPTDPIKPNRKLIVVAGTVLAGFLGLFVALITLAVKPKN